MLLAALQHKLLLCIQVPFYEWSDVLDEGQEHLGGGGAVMREYLTHKLAPVGQSPALSAPC